MGALVVLPKGHGVPRVPRRMSTAPGPTVSVLRPSGPVGHPLSVLGREGRCQTRHGSMRVRALAFASPGSWGARDGEGLEWRDAVAKVVRSEVTRSLVTMLSGSTPRPAERRGRARRSSRLRGRDNSSSPSTTDVSRSGDDSAFAVLLGSFRDTPTPSTVREGTGGIDPRAQPTPDSVGVEQGGGGARELLRGINPRFPTQLSPATGTKAEGWPTPATPTPPTRVVPPKIVVSHQYYRMILDCETYALYNESVVYTRRQARTLGRRNKDVAKYIGVLDDWDGLLHSAGAKSTTFPPAGTCARLSVLRIAACGTAVPP